MCWAQLCPRLAQHALGLEHVCCYLYVFFGLFRCVFPLVCSIVLVSNPSGSLSVPAMVRHVLHFSPTCQVRVVWFLCQLAASSSFSSSAGPQLQARDRSGPCRARKPRIRVTGPQLQARDRSGPCRTRAASPGSE